jgi:hypothetical protein
MSGPNNNEGSNDTGKRKRNPTTQAVVAVNEKKNDSCDATCHHPQSRRRLVVPSSLQEWELQLQQPHFDAYCDNNNDGGALWRSILWDRIPRVLPSSHILASRQFNSTTKSNKATITHISPILADFYKAVGQSVVVEGKDDCDDNDEDANLQKKSASEETLNHKEDSTPPLPEEGATTTTATSTTVDAIDDPSLGTLTRGQHQRYLQLTNRYQTDRRTEKQRQELRQLTASVVQEQQVYRKAFAQFFEKHSHRFLIGFLPSVDTTARDEASSFARIASYMSERANEPYQENTFRTTADPASARDICTRFGKCRQILSAQIPTASTSKKGRPLLDVDSLKFETVHRSETIPNSIGENLPPIHSRIPHPRKECLPSRTLLQQDERAQQLALQYKAAILTSAETIETMLQLPGDYRTQWMLYGKAMTVHGTSNNNNNNNNLSSSSNKSQRICILDLPIAQPFLSPRACLEAGFEEGIYQWLEAASATGERSSSTASMEPTPVQYVYTLWTLPELHTANISSSRRIVVLIRSTVRLCHKHADHPVRIRARMDYFPERGREIPTSYDKALWILDQLLLGAPSSSDSSRGSGVFTKVGRVDPKRCKLLEWDDTSIAHAFAEDNDTTTFVKTTGGQVDPLTHWHVLVQLLQSVPTIDSSGGRGDSHYLLCLPGRGNQSATPVLSVSVHARDDHTTTSSILEGNEAEAAEKALAAAGKIDFATMVFPQADTVRLGNEALRCDCPRDWKWEFEDRIPYTFPLSEQKLHKRPQVARHGSKL